MVKKEKKSREKVAKKGKSKVIKDTIERDIQAIVSVVKKRVKNIDIYAGEETSELGVRDWLKTGNIALDWVVGSRGFPYGRIVEVYGDYSSGKTWLALLLIAAAQRGGALAVLIETEVSFEPDFAVKMGIDLKRLIVLKPETVEEVFDSVDAVLKGNKSGRPICIAWDSVAATPTEHEMTTDMLTRDMTKAQQMGKGVRKIAKMVGDNGGLFLVINQVRDKIGVLFGDKESRPGGRAVEFHATLMLHFKKGGKILNEKNEVIGFNGKILCTKSKICTPFRETQIGLIPGLPVPEYEGMLPILVKKGFVIETAGKSEKAKRYTFVGAKEGDDWKAEQFLEKVLSQEGQVAVQQALDK